MRGYGLDSSGQPPGTGSCEKNNVHSGSIKYGYFLDWLRSYRLLRNSAPLVSLLVGPYILDYLWRTLSLYLQYSLFREEHGLVNILLHTKTTWMSLRLEQRVRLCLFSGDHRRTERTRYQWCRLPTSICSTRPTAHLRLQPHALGGSA